MQKTISILGCGWYGLALAKHLLANGYQVKGSTTSADKLPSLQTEGIEPYLVSFNEQSINYDPAFFNSHTLVICIPPKRSSAEQASFPDKITEICKAANNNTIKNVLFISSTSVYGDRNTELSETDEPNPDTPSGKAMKQAEAILKNQQVFNTTILRFGGLIGPGRDPGKFFAGKVNSPNGQSPINLIHLTDCVGISTHIIETESFGHTFNACTPHHPEKQVFYTQASINSGLVAPTFINELTTWKIINSNQSSTVLKYNYQITNWVQWLQKGKL
jgi:nucleoside-diphosphate-sugar epimerase